MSALNYRHLYYFWVVAKEGGMARAAQRLDFAFETTLAPGANHIEVRSSDPAGNVAVAAVTVTFTPPPPTTTKPAPPAPAPKPAAAKPAPGPSVRFAYS